MFPIVPLPRWTDLAAAFAVTAPDDSALAKPWRRGGETAFWYARSAWAMAALARAVAVREHPPVTVWLPGYFCNQSLEPTRAAGARVVFYPVDPNDLRPDWSACRSLAASAPPDLFVLVHTFGRANDGDGARGFCDETGALLIEDAAHALGPAPGIGAHGDAVFYSPAKTLAVPHGGLLLVRGSDPVLHIETGGAAAPIGTWMVKRAIQKVLPASALAARVRRRWPDFDRDPDPVELPPTPGLGIASRRLIACTATNLAAAATRRRANARVLADTLGDLPGCRPLFTLGDDDPAPYRFVLRCNDAQSLFDRWRSAGLPVETWPDLPPEVAAAPEIHAGAIELRRTLLLLPVHQTLNPCTLGVYRAHATSR